MATTGQSIVDRACILLNDVSSTVRRWPDAELLKWLNDGQLFIAVVRPDSVSATTSVTLVAGSKQTIPTDGLRLLDVVRNLSTNKAVRYTDRMLLDTSIPDWHAVRQSFLVTNWVYDNRVPLTFYVYPPAKEGTQLEINYSKLPTALSGATPALALAGNIALPDIYADALLNYIMFRAYSKDTENATNPQLAASYLALLSGQLGIKTTTDVAYSPDRHDRGAAPNESALQGGSV